jgi:hypothetical protein
MKNNPISNGSYVLSDKYGSIPLRSEPGKSSIDMLAEARAPIPPEASTLAGAMLTSLIHGAILFIPLGCGERAEHHLYVYMLVLVIVLEPTDSDTMPSLDFTVIVSEVTAVISN